MRRDEALRLLAEHRDELTGMGVGSLLAVWVGRP